jgi:transcriptional regulator with GAF, ATPase, and Fis domain
MRIPKPAMAQWSGDDPLFVRNGYGMAEPVPLTIAELAGELAGGAGIEEVLKKLTLASLALVPSADFAKISIVDNSGLFSLAATSQLTTTLDTAQQAARQGPCLEAISARKTIRCDDLQTDARWPRFAPHATTVGVHSVLSSPIDIPGDIGATLSLFGVRAQAFGAESETVGAMLANHAAIALVHDEHERQFRAALATRDIIGQAKGIVMERFGVDASRAFGMLAAISQDTNTPVRDLAVRLVGSAMH